MISKCMFNGNRTIEHEENVVRIVNLFSKKESKNGSNFVTQKKLLFSQKLLLVDF